MNPHIVVFSSMLAAIAHVVGEDASHYFTITENRAYVTLDVEGLPNGAGYMNADIASTLAAWAMNDSRTTGVIVGSEAHYGSIIAHYTETGEIVRFLAIAAR